MGYNTGKGYRQGAVVNRSQTFNPKTEQFVKRDATTGKFLACKPTVYKGVSKENTAKNKINNT